ncbi:MAG: 50S ribosomal protein L23 [Parcubacteria group bacterium]
MAWFWQRKKQQREEQQAAQTQAATKKRGLFTRPRTVQKTASTKGAATRKTKPGPKKIVAAYGVLLGPVVTEKAARLADQDTFVFEVTPKANKIQVAEAVAGVYGVHPMHVSILNTHAKPKRFGFKPGVRSSYRKAYVTLSSGEHIDFFESEQPKSTK